jgi:hypothetical protein
MDLVNNIDAVPYRAGTAEETPLFFFQAAAPPERSRLYVL